MVALLREGRLESRRAHRRDRQRAGRRALQRLLHAGADDRGRPEGDAAREPLERRVRRGLPGDGAVVARPRAVPRRRLPRSWSSCFVRQNVLMTGSMRVGGRRIDLATPAATSSTRWPSATTSSRRPRSSRSCALVGDPARREELRLPGGHVTFGTGQVGVQARPCRRLAGWIVAHSDELSDTRSDDGDPADPARRPGGARSRFFAADARGATARSSRRTSTIPTVVDALGTARRRARRSPWRTARSSATWRSCRCTAGRATSARSGSSSIPSARGRGIGRALARRAVLEAVELGAGEARRRGGRRSGAADRDVPRRSGSSPRRCSTDHVRDRSGELRDLIVLAHSVESSSRRCRRRDRGQL